MIVHTWLLSAGVADSPSGGADSPLLRVKNVFMLWLLSAGVADLPLGGAESPLLRVKNAFMFWGVSIDGKEGLCFLRNVLKEALRPSCSVS